MDIARPEDWDEKKELVSYLLDIIEQDELLRNKFANLIVDVFDKQTGRRGEYQDNHLAREALSHIVRNEIENYEKSRR